MQQLLHEYKIGELDAPTDDRSIPDPYAHEARLPRPSNFKVRGAKPYNAEPPAEFADALVTPTELMYIRNHLPVPTIDPDTYRLEVEVQGETKLELSLAELRAMPRHTVTACMQCGGNRRSAFTEVKEVKGLDWGSAAISNAIWGGVRLRDVLRLAGVTPDAEEAYERGLVNVVFSGLDVPRVGDFKDPEGGYSAHIDIDKGLAPEVLLAFEMNGEPLPADHGFPLRVVVPGYVGARNVKWLGKISVGDEEAKSLWQRKVSTCGRRAGRSGGLTKNNYKDYKLMSPEHDMDDVEDLPPMNDMPPQSSCTRLDVSDDDGSITASGYAWSGGGRGIARVEISVDGGTTWEEAELTKAEQPPHKTWSWTLWSVRDLGAGEDVEHVIVKATDIAGNVQPQNSSSIWNLRGLNSNAWDRIYVRPVKKESSPAGVPRHT